MYIYIYIYIYIHTIALGASALVLNVSVEYMIHTCLLDITSYNIKNKSHTSELVATTYNLLYG